MDARARVTEREGAVADDMDIAINGQPVRVPDRATLISALAAAGIDPTRGGIAVAVDGEVVPRRAWEETTLRPGVVIEVVTATQGG